MIGIALFLIAFSVISLLIYRGNRSVKLNKMKIEAQRLPSSFDGYRIIHISDLHNEEFGKKNGKLLALVESARPDIIAITGDLIDSRRTNIKSAAEAARRLAEIAPVYYVTGNHESRIGNYGELEALLCSAGVKILNNETAKIEKNGEEIAIIGLKDPAFYSDIATPEKEIVAAFLREALCKDQGTPESTHESLLKESLELPLEKLPEPPLEKLPESPLEKLLEPTLEGSDESSFGILLEPALDESLRLQSAEMLKKPPQCSKKLLRCPQKTGSHTIYSVLLCHRPQFFDIFAENGVDLTLSGHAHGGQFRIPFLGGLYAPEQGFLPKYNAGIYKSGASNMVVSCGLGNSTFPFRFNNRPEVLLITLKKPL